MNEILAIIVIAFFQEVIEDKDMQPTSFLF